MFSREKIFLTGCSEHVPVSLYCHQAGKNRVGCSVLMIHGFKGFASWGFFVPLAESICELGFDVYRLNFSMNGLSPEFDMEITRPEEFRKNTFSAEVQEVDLACSFVRRHSGNDDLILLGHSRGGGIALLSGANPLLRIKAVIALAPVSDFVTMLAGYDDNAWLRNGFASVVNGRTGEQLPMNYELKRDAGLPRNKLSERLRSLSCAVYLIHGKNDKTVDIAHSYAIKSIVKHAQLNVIEGAGHTFNIVHPYSETDTVAKAGMMELCSRVHAALNTIFLFE